jgi:hypothetical protein
LDANEATAPDILILDELGPLEFSSNQGLTVGFELIERRLYRLACMTIRPSLLPVALERWPWAHEIHLDRAVEAT